MAEAAIDGGRGDGLGDLGDVEPRSVLGRAADFQPVRQAFGRGWRERSVERGGGMGVQRPGAERMTRSRGKPVARWPARHASHAAVRSRGSG